MTKNFKEKENHHGKQYHKSQSDHKDFSQNHEQCDCEENEKCDLSCGEMDCEYEMNETIQEENCREEEFKETLQRLQAEFDNYRKRTDASMERVKQDGIIFAINKLLPVLDSFKSAKMLVKDEEFLKSLSLIEKQFVDGLSALNVTKIEAENQMFDPKFHNAVISGNDPEKQDGEILEVFQDGYKLCDRVIRHSVVKINKLS